MYTQNTPETRTCLAHSSRVCVCVCVHIYIRIHIHVYTKHTRSENFFGAFLTFMCVCVCVCVCVHIHIHIYTYAQNTPDARTSLAHSSSHANRLRVVIALNLLSVTNSLSWFVCASANITFATSCTVLPICFFGGGRGGWGWSEKKFVLICVHVFKHQTKHIQVLE